jgi:predicted SprT family Zn-dependent metalloprotease
MEKDREILERMDKINEEISSLNKLLKKYVKEDEVGFRCSKCDSSFVYIRRKDKKLLCRKCGNIENINIEGDNK